MESTILNLCDFGCNNTAIKLFKSGKYCCSHHVSSCPSMKDKNNRIVEPFCGWSYIQKEYNDGMSVRDLEKKYNRSFGRAIKKGLLKVRTLSESIILASKQNKCGFNSWSIEKQKEHIERNRISALFRHQQGWDNKAGRCKKITYVSQIAGEITVDGTWELAVAKWLDNQKYNWKRNRKKFPYINLEGKLSNYTPDFWVEELKAFLEIKGYETELDRCKWSQFTESLIVWKKKDLKKIGVVP